VLQDPVFQEIRFPAVNFSIRKHPKAQSGKHVDGFPAFEFLAK